MMMKLASRTTLTLEEDVRQRVERYCREKGRSFKSVINELLRSGLEASQTRRPIKKFHVKARKLGLRKGLSYDNVGDLLEMLDREEKSG